MTLVFLSMFHLVSTSIWHLTKLDNRYGIEIIHQSIDLRSIGSLLLVHWRVWSNPKVLIWFWTSVSLGLAPPCPQPDLAFSELYAPPRKRWGGIVLEPRPPAQLDPSPCRWFKIIGFRFASLVLASKAPLVLKPAFLVHLGIVGRFHEGLNRVWYRPPGSALGYEEYPSLIVRFQLCLTYCHNKIKDEY